MLQCKSKTTKRSDKIDAEIVEDVDDAPEKVLLRNYYSFKGTEIFRFYI